MSEKEPQSVTDKLQDLLPSKKNARVGAWVAGAAAAFVFWNGVLSQEDIEGFAPEGAKEVETDKLGDIVFKLPAEDVEEVYCGGVKTDYWTPFVTREHDKEVEFLENDQALVTCKGVFGTRIRVQGEE